jgi:hypothetical protein
VNQNVCLLDKRADDLMKALKNGSIDVHSLVITAVSVLNLFFPQGQPASDSGETLAQARDRIEHQYAAEIAQLDGAAMREAFRDTVLGFETSAQLAKRDIMIIYGITANEGELAGGGLQAFLGFFDRRFREHDYDVGRKRAQEVLLNLGTDKNSLGPLRYKPTPFRPIDDGLNRATLTQLSAGEVEMFRKGMKRRANQILHALHWQGADAIADLAVRAIIRHTTEPRPLNPEKPLGDLDSDEML